MMSDGSNDAEARRDPRTGESGAPGGVGCANTFACGSAENIGLSSAGALADVLAGFGRANTSGSAPVSVGLLGARSRVTTYRTFLGKPRCSKARQRHQTWRGSYGKTLNKQQNAALNRYLSFGMPLA